MITSRELTFVVQGPILHANNGKTPFSTADCLNSIRLHFPDSPIVLSTYEGADVSDCSYDILLLNQDPGSCLNLWRKTESRSSNINRMIISSKNGLEVVTTPYSCKTRADIFFQSNHLLRLNEGYVSRNPFYTFTKERMIVSDFYTKNPRIAKHCCFHISDVLIIGRSADLLSLFSIPLATPETLQNKFNETYLWHAFISKHVSSNFKHCLNVDEESLDLHDAFLANNVVVYHAADFHAVFPFHNNRFLSRFFHRWTMYTHREWKYLYEIYSCENKNRRFIYLYWLIHYVLYRFFDTLVQPHRWLAIMKKRILRISNSN